MFYAQMRVPCVLPIDVEAAIVGGLLLEHMMQSFHLQLHHYDESAVVVVDTHAVAARHRDVFLSGNDHFLHCFHFPWNSQIGSHQPLDRPNRLGIDFDNAVVEIVAMIRSYLAGPDSMDCSFLFCCHIIQK